MQKDLFIEKVRESIANDNLDYAIIELSKLATNSEIVKEVLMQKVRSISSPKAMGYEINNI